MGIAETPHDARVAMARGTEKIGAQMSAGATKVGAQVGAGAGKLGSRVGARSAKAGLRRGIAGVFFGIRAAIRGWLFGLRGMMFGARKGMRGGRAGGKAALMGARYGMPRRALFGRNRGPGELHETSRRLSAQVGELQDVVDTARTLLDEAADQRPRRHGRSWAMSGAAIGASAAFLLDPEHGSSRRKAARERMKALARRGATATTSGPTEPAPPGGETPRESRFGEQRPGTRVGDPTPFAGGI